MRPVVSLFVGLMLLGGPTPAPAGLDDPPQGEPVKLTYKWEPGMTTYYRMITTSESKSVMEGREYTLRDRTAMMSRTEVYSVRDDGTARVATTIVRVRREHEDPAKGTSVYDSATSTSDKIATDMKMYGRLVNKTIIAEVTPEGRTLHVQGIDELIQDMMKGLETDDPGFAKYSAESGLAKQMRDTLSHMTSQALPSDQMMSAAPRRVGDQWPGSKKLPMFGNDVTNETLYRLESVDTVAGRRIAQVSMTGKTSMKYSPASPDAPKPTSPVANLESSGSEQGVFIFDLDRGRPLRSEIRLTSASRRGETTIAGHTMPGSDMKLTVTMLMELVGPEDSIDPQSEGTKGK